MNVQPWVPTEISAYLARTNSFKGIADRAMAVRIHEMWTRLATRPEMETVWSFIVASEYQFPLTANGGLVGIVNRGLRNFERSPKLSSKDYEEELLEISKMAETLARKMRKFRNAGPVYNPFPLNALLNDVQMQRASVLVRPELKTGPRGDMAHSALDYYLPSLDEQLEGLADLAATEGTTQAHRFKGPRKLSDKNAFRTYFIHLIADYFFSAHADYSPTRIATFSSVALDDANITADLVGKACRLNQEQKGLLAIQGVL